MKRTAILFTTHVINDLVRSHFRKLRQELPAGYDLVLFFDEDRISPEQARQFAGDGVAVLPHEAEGWKRFKRPGHTFQTKIPGNDDGLILNGIDRLPGYDWYWYIEYDVAFSGDWRYFFEAMEKSDADLLGTSISRHEEIPDWNWWPSLEMPAGMELPESRCIRVHLAISRYSRRLFDVLVPEYANGWAGCAEAVVGTLALEKGLGVEDIGCDGEFVKDRNRNRFYRSTRVNKRLSPGTFVFRPSMEKVGKEPNMLWHPVKVRSADDWDYKPKEKKRKKSRIERFLIRIGFKKKPE